MGGGEQREEVECVCERERWQREERGERASVRASVCVCERERGRAREMRSREEGEERREEGRERGRVRERWRESEKKEWQLVRERGSEGGRE